MCRKTRDIIESPFLPEDVFPVSKDKSATNNIFTGLLGGAGDWNSFEKAKQALGNAINPFSTVEGEEIEFDRRDVLLVESSHDLWKDMAQKLVEANILSESITKDESLFTINALQTYFDTQLSKEKAKQAKLFLDMINPLLNIGEELKIETEKFLGSSNGIWSESIKKLVQKSHMFSLSDKQQQSLFINALETYFDTQLSKEKAGQAKQFLGTISALSNIGEDLEIKVGKSMITEDSSNEIWTETIQKLLHANILSVSRTKGNVFTDALQTHFDTQVLHVILFIYIYNII